MDVQNPEAATKDGGCVGWLVVLGTHVCSIYVFGAYHAIGPLFVIIQDHFEETSARTSWIIALLMSMEYLLAPLSNVCVKKIGFRMTVAVGTLFSSTGYFLSAWAHRIELLYLTIGLLVGLGYALVMPAAVGIVSLYVRKRYTLANVLASSGAGLAVFIFPPLLQTLIDFYGWRGAVIVFSAINANMGISAALFRAPQKDRKLSSKQPALQKTKLSAKCGKFITDTCDFRVFTDFPTFALFVVASTVAVGIGISSSPTHLLARAETKNLGSPRAISLIVSVFGVAGIVGRFSILLILHVTQKCTTSIKVFAFAACSTGVTNLASSLATNYASYMVYAVCFGTFFGLVYGLIPQIIRDLLGSEMLTAGAGISTLFIGLGSLIGPPCAGFIYDVTGDYNNSFYFYGALLTFGGLIIFVMEPYTSRRQRMSENATSKEVTDDVNLHQVCHSEAATQTGGDDVIMGRENRPSGLVNLSFKS